MYRYIETQNKTSVKLEILNDIDYDKLNQLQKYAQSAYDDLVKAIEFATKERNNDSLLDKIKVVYGTKRSAYAIQYDIISILNKLKDRFEEGLIFVSSSRYFSDLKNNKYEQILAVVFKAFKDIIYIFKPFFEENNELDNRGSVLLHELTHMIGLESEKDRNDINSAESLRNIILLLTDRVSSESLLEDIKNAPEKSKMPTNVFAYSEDQPRVPKGNSDGGQWTDGNNASGSSKSDSDKSDNYKNNKNNSKGANSRVSPPKAIKKELDLLDDKTLSELVNINKPIDPKEIFDKLKFNPNGDDEYFNAIKNPFDTLNILFTNKKKEAIETAMEIYKTYNRLVDGDGDAFRHTLLSYRLSELIGIDDAKKFMNAHERSGEISLPSNLMDLVNNQIGFSLYNKYKKRGLDNAIKIIYDAQQKGLLREKPYTIKK